MKAIHGFTLFFWFGATGLGAAAGTESARSFVQATILGANPARATLTFLDASGRQRVERATGEALAALSAVRPGDQAILSLSTEAGRSVVTRLRVHRAEPPAAAAGASATTTAAPGASWPLRRSWPNPYAKGTHPPPDRP